MCRGCFFVALLSVGTSLGDLLVGLLQTHQRGMVAGKDRLGIFQCGGKILQGTGIILQLDTAVSQFFQNVDVAGQWYLHKAYPTP